MQAVGQCHIYYLHIYWSQLPCMGYSLVYSEWRPVRMLFCYEQGHGGAIIAHKSLHCPNVWIKISFPGLDGVGLGLVFEGLEPFESHTVMHLCKLKQNTILVNFFSTTKQVQYFIHETIVVLMCRTKRCKLTV